jgi:hypothetical protein
MRLDGIFKLLRHSLEISLCIAVVMGLGPIRAFAWKDSGAESDLQAPGGGAKLSLATLSAELGAAFSEWKGLPSSEIVGKVPAIRTRIDAELTAYVTSRLGESPRPTGLSIEGDLNKVLATATWQSVFGMSPEQVREALDSNAAMPLAHVLEGSGAASGLFAAAFAIGFGNLYSTRVHAFGRRGEHYRGFDPAVGPLDGAVSGIIALRPFAAKELRFLVWSLHIGSPEALTTVALYRFDGSALQSLWTAQNVPAAKVTLAEGLVVIESHSGSFTKEGTLFRYERRLYEQTTGGLKEKRTTRWTER